MVELKVSVEFEQYASATAAQVRSVIEMVSGAAEGPRVPFELCFVLDTSGSMAGAKLNNLKEAVLAALDLLVDEDLIHIVTYSDAPRALCVGKTISDRIAIVDSINGMTANGGTNISAALQFGAQLIAQNRRDVLNPPRLFLYTDGQPTNGMITAEDFSGLASELHGEQGILMSVFGIGTDVNAELLESMADSGGGLYNFLTTRRIVELTKKAMQGLASVIGTRGVVRVELSSASIGVAQPPVTSENRLLEAPHGSFTVPIGDVRHSNLHNIAVAMHVPASLAVPGERVMLGKATLQYTPVENPLSTVTSTADISVRFVDEGTLSPHLEAAPSVRVAFGLVVMSGLTSEAEALLTDGKREEAISRMAAGIAQLEACEALDETDFVSTALRRARRTLERIRADHSASGTVRAAMELQQQRANMDRMSGRDFEQSDDGNITPPYRTSPTRPPSGAPFSFAI